MSIQTIGAGQVERRTGFLVEMLRVSIIASAAFALQLAWSFVNSRGLLIGPGAPFGSDFINIWAAGLLLLSGDAAQVYVSAAFASFQQALAGEFIGYRLWAYPPHSLLFVWPFGLTGYYLSFALWSGLGFVVLGWGARRFGFSWVETGILMLCPAAAQSVLNGQSGNLMCGLLLLALASDKGGRSALAAALMTVKPQAGFLIPVVWIIRRNWRLVAMTTLLSVLLVGASVVFFGLQSWTDYAGDTLRELSELERYGKGPFLYMIPSAFISFRLLGFDGDTAMLMHVGVAVAVFAALVVVLARTDRPHQAALLLIATCLITPYLHFYDLTILLAGVLLLLRASAASRRAACSLVCLVWALPLALIPLGKLGIPIAPLLILSIFVFGCRQALSAPAQDQPGTDRLAPAGR